MFCYIVHRVSPTRRTKDIRERQKRLLVGAGKKHKHHNNELRLTQHLTSTNPGTEPNKGYKPVPNYHKGKHSLSHNERRALMCTKPEGFVAKKEMKNMIINNPPQPQIKARNSSFCNHIAPSFILLLGYTILLDKGQFVETLYHMVNTPGDNESRVQ
jgi:hypothetical protein